MSRAWSNLRGVEVLSRSATSADGRRGWLVVPKAAAGRDSEQAT